MRLPLRTSFVVFLLIPVEVAVSSVVAGCSAGGGDVMEGAGRADASSVRVDAGMPNEVDAAAPDASVADVGAGSADASSVRVDASAPNEIDAAAPDASVADVGAGRTDAGPDANSELTATTATLAGPGLNDCGSGANDVCARSLLVSGGTFNRGKTLDYPATIGAFRLDKYEVTVGRFRKFVDAWVGGWRPSAGSGKHTHLNAGSGLVNTAGGTEPGWDAAWTAYVGAPALGSVAPSGAGATTKASWDTNVSCGGSFTAWTSDPGPNERRPMNCLSWYDLHAFCIWDGGFLPSEAEWEYAAAGGSEERTYPWGNTEPGPNAALAIYNCYFANVGSCSGSSNLAPVGSVAAGEGKWGQLDLAGNMGEWILDWYQSPFVASCSNCTNLTAGSLRVLRGGSFVSDASSLLAAYRYSPSPASRNNGFGGRCARRP